MTPQKAKTEDAIELLKQDHRTVEAAFAKFEKLPANAHAKRKELATLICEELLRHMAIEEELFYPSVEAEVEGADDVVKESIVEHAAARTLIQEIMAMKGDEELFESKVHVLKEQIEHHVKEEEEEMFPKVKKSSMDLEGMAEELMERKEELEEAEA